MNKNILVQEIQIQKIGKQTLCFHLGYKFITLLFWGIRKTVFNVDNIKSSNVIIEEMYEIEFPIIIEKSLATYEYDFLARGYHAYMDIWNPLIGEVSKYKREATNEVDWHAVAIMQSNSLGKESVIWHILQNISKFSSMFLMITFIPIKVEVVGKRLILEVTMDWKFRLNIVFTTKKILSNGWLNIL